MDSLRLILSNRLYFAPAWVFASLNIMTGTWVLYLPHIKTKFGLNDAEIGLALFCVALGLLISIPFIPLINRLIGVGRSTKMGIFVFALVFNLPLLAPTFDTLCACLLLVGVFSGFTDISMNALVSTIENTQKRQFMAAAHGFFSLGGFIGAGLGSILIALFSSPIWHMFSVSLFIIMTNLYVSNNYNKIKEAAVEKRSKESKLKSIRPLLGLALVAFIIMFHEGAVEHWSNLFLFDVVQVSESKAGLGFIAFSLCMTIGRFFGDGLSQKVGTIGLICYGCLIAFVAYLFIMASNLIITVFGFGLLGLGLSVIIPELTRLGGNTKGVAASVGISIVAGIGFLGFLIGPVLLGLISNWSSLLASFGFLAGLILLAIGIIYFRLRKLYGDV
jgi:fucose permease